MMFRKLVVVASLLGANGLMNKPVESLGGNITNSESLIGEVSMLEMSAQNQEASEPSVYVKSVPDDYVYTSMKEAQAACEAEGLRLCFMKEMLHLTRCVAGWVADGFKGYPMAHGKAYYSSMASNPETYNRRNWCGGDRDGWRMWNSEKARAHCCKIEQKKCPTDVWTRSTDLDEMSYTDVNGDLFNVISASDNAGFWENNGWSGIPKITPSKTALKNAVYPVGSTYKIFMLDDEAGNLQRCKVEIVVEDKQPPVANCPGTQIHEFTNPEGGCKVNLQWEIPNPTDNDELKNLKVEGPTHGEFTKGTYKYQVNVEDKAKNSDSCTFQVLVEDKAKPLFQRCGPKKDVYTFTCNAEKDHTVAVDFDCSATDNCDHHIAPSYNKWVKVSGNVGFHAGLHQQANHDSRLDTCEKIGSGKTFADVCSLKAFCVVDTANNCAYDIEFMTDDVVKALGSKEVYFYNKNNNNKFPIAAGPEKTTYTVDVEAKDKSNNKDTASIAFTTAYSTEKPGFKFCPPLLTVLEYDEKKEGVAAGYQMPVVRSECHTKLVEVRGFTPQTILTAGTHDFHYIATDAGGNEAECRFQIEVRDKAEIDWDGANSCPENIALQTDPKLRTSAIATWAQPVPMFRGKAVTADQATIDWGMFKSGMAFPIGTTIVNFTITDKREHMAKRKIPCEFEVEVTDKEEPSFTYEAPKCAPNTVGVPSYSQCGGVELQYTYNKATKVVAHTEVKTVTKDCCNRNESCKPYKGSTQVSLCQ